MHSIMHHIGLEFLKDAKHLSQKSLKMNLDCGNEVSWRLAQPLNQTPMSAAVKCFGRWVVGPLKREAPQDSVM